MNALFRSISIKFKMSLLFPFVPSLILVTELGEFPDA